MGRRRDDVIATLISPHGSPHLTTLRVPTFSSAGRSCGPDQLTEFAARLLRIPEAPGVRSRWSPLRTSDRVVDAGKRRQRAKLAVGIGTSTRELLEMTFDSPRPSTAALLLLGGAPVLFSCATQHRRDGCSGAQDCPGHEVCIAATRECASEDDAVRQEDGTFAVRTVAAGASAAPSTTPSGMHPQNEPPPDPATSENGQEWFRCAVRSPRKSRQPHWVAMAA